MITTKLKTGNDKDKKNWSEELNQILRHFLIELILFKIQSFISFIIYTIIKSLQIL